MDDESEINPYASPISAATYTPYGADSLEAGLWRDDKDLVIHNDARLPNVCVKSGVPTAEQGIRRKFSWHNPWVGVAILANVIVYIILAMILSKKSTFEIPLSSEERGKRKNWLIFCWTLGIASVTMFGVCIYFLLDSRNSPPAAGIGLFVSIVLFLVALLVGQAKARILRPTKITETHTWLRGVHGNVLDRLPKMPPMAQ